jgi:DNA helicase-2/ATP-dependent DNA helicase PcrA
VLYRTNSQSRLVEEALRRYQIQYHMVGGFSFYDRAEVKDILSYLKVVSNPHDSIGLARVINSPARGIGKTTLETLERMALSSGMSTWDAIGRAIEDRLLPARAMQALSGFRRLIEDARAMLGPGFAEKLTADVEVDASLPSDATEASDADTSFGFGAEADSAVSTEPEDAGADTSFDTSFNFGFDFGPSEEMSAIAAENSVDSDAAHGIDVASFNPFAPVVLKSSAAGSRRIKADPPPSAKDDNVVRGGSAKDDSVVRGGSAKNDSVVAGRSAEERPAFRKPGDPATLPELIKFLNDRSGYIRALEEEATPESFSRI